MLYILQYNNNVNNLCVVYYKCKRIFFEIFFIKKMHLCKIESSRLEIKKQRRKNTAGHVPKQIASPS